MFIGEYEHSIDAKNRVIIPSKFREGLGEKFVITKGLEQGCLLVFPMDEWKNFEDKLKSLPFGSKEARTFSRYFFSSASECEIDKQGRTVITSNLKEYAKLEKDVVIIGVSSRVEIWSKEKWEELNNDENLDMEDISEKMAMLGI